MGLYVYEEGGYPPSEVEYGVFPGGEVYLKTDLSDLSSITCVHLDFRRSDDLMALLLLDDALTRLGCKSKNGCTLYIPYFPYARQDRFDKDQGAVNQSLSLKVVTNLINSLNYPKVVVIEPHSSVTTALLNNVVSVDMDAYVELTDPPEDIVVICPDQGAIKRSERFAKHHGITEMIMCEKKRDMSTGKILGTVVHNIEKLNQEGKIGVIVDDICDGGRTFIEIAKKIRELGCENRLELFVAHGIFSKGKEELKEYFDVVEAVNDFTKGA
jgi:ribose-phosphate pyrophosphokinase